MARQTRRTVVAIASAGIQSVGIALAVGALLAGAMAYAQTAKVPYPPRNVDVRIAESQIRQNQEREARKQLQESRLRRLTGSGDAAQGSAPAVPDSNSVAAARIAAQSLIGATVLAAAISAFTDSGSILMEAESGSGAGSSSSASSVSSATSTTTTSSATSTN